MKIYLLGPVTDATDETVATFVQAERQLKADGHTVVNILWLNGWHNEPAHAQAACRINYMARCEGVFVMPDWRTDKIAEMEFAVAAITGMQILFANGVPKPRNIQFIIP